MLRRRAEHDALVVKVDKMLMKVVRHRLHGERRLPEETVVDESMCLSWSSVKAINSVEISHLISGDAGYLGGLEDDDLPSL